MLDEVPQNPAVRDPTRAAKRFGDQFTPAEIAAPRAERPRPPELPQALRRKEAERDTVLRTREALERGSMLRGLIYLALLTLLISLVRAGMGRAFPSGWR